MARFDNEGMFWQDKQATLRSDKAPKVEQVKSLPAPLACTFKESLPFPDGRFEEAYQPSSKPQAIMDIEVYSNYFLVNFMRLSDNKILGFEQEVGSPLDKISILEILSKYEIITFNGNYFDMPLLRVALTDVDNATLKVCCDDMILQKMSPWNIEKKYRLPPFEVNHIDLIELPQGQGSLKVYGGRLHCHKMQDLPISPDAVLTRLQMDEIRTYCGNDLDVTRRLFLKLQPQIALRRTMSNQYNLDLRSKSDAQIAEIVLISEITKATGKKPGRNSVTQGQFLYKAPDFISFSNPVLQSALATVTTKPFTVTNKGKIEMPRELSMLKVALGTSTYQMGMGGLHSTEGNSCHVSDDENLIVDWDVTSYYPSIILNCELYPKQFGEVFLDVYRKIVTERIEAKDAGDKIKADALKITINSSFGKFGSSYSSLFSPELLVQVTLTGQLALLMLIEQLELAGIAVVSANTDGVLVRCPVESEELMKQIILNWELKTTFNMERSDVAGHYGRDVNSYISIDASGKSKLKGCFSIGGLSKNPSNEICNIAMIEYLKHGIPFDETIEECTDITKFISVRAVTGGAVKDGKFLGKTVRWYYSDQVKGTIKYKSNDHDVPKTLGARPLMDLPDDFPSDIDYKWYIKECYKLF